MEVCETSTGHIHMHLYLLKTVHLNNRKDAEYCQLHPFELNCYYYYYYYHYYLHYVPHLGISSIINILMSAAYQYLQRHKGKEFGFNTLFNTLLHIFILYHYVFR